MTTLVAYHNDPAIKQRILLQLEMHRVRDEIIKGQYWDSGKGCAIGCTIHSGNHSEYEARFGIPQMLARLEDCIFEGLPNSIAKDWPVRFMGAIEPGKDLSCVGWQFLHWLLTDSRVNPGIDHPLVKDAVKRCADLLVPLGKGESVVENEAWDAASAAKSAANEAWSAMENESRSAKNAAASAVASAAKSAAASAAWSAAWNAPARAGNTEWGVTLESAEWSAAWNAANSTKSAAASAAWSTEGGVTLESAEWNAEESAACAAAFLMMADKLVELLRAS